jgi:microsomal dipeptidase-like Zn-dependent dipeptidase
MHYSRLTPSPAPSRGSGALRPSAALMKATTMIETCRILPERHQHRAALRALAIVGLVATAPGCKDESANCPGIEPRQHTVHSVANACVSLSAERSGETQYVTSSGGGTRFSFRSKGSARAARFFAKASDLGTYVLRDEEGHYAIAEGGTLARTATLTSDTLLNDDSFISPAEWLLEVSPVDATRFRFRNRATNEYLGDGDVTADVARAADIAIDDTCGCAEFPEMSLDATGTVARTTFEDGTLYGVVDTHSHLFTNFGFGGGGTFHGSPFHRLGVEHALSDCSTFHGFEGRRDLVGYFYGGAEFDLTVGATALILGEVQEFNHFTAGYPDFTSWPNAGRSSTHQTQYYKWVERAYLAGLRLMVQHATSNEVLCQLATGAGAQTERFSCNDMVSAERTIDETYALERYVDAQSGGPGLGWFRVVTSPAQARAVIAEGKLAVVLGIETSNLFDCFVTPREGFPACTPESVRERLDHFTARGVRVLFPVHKFDNGFSAGDGNRGFIEMGNVINSNHYSNFTTDCDLSVPAPFDRGGVVFGGLNQPRPVYDAPGPLDFTDFDQEPAAALVPYLGLLGEPPLEGEYCQNAGLTPLGETLLTEMMLRGMIIEIDHLPRRSYARAVEMLIANDYPAAGTHGSNANGTLYALGGVSALGLPRCGNAANPSAPSEYVRSRIDAIVAQGGYPAQGFSFDFNGFAGAPGPRFGEEAGCGDPQTNPITYPFTSYAGDVTFSAPRLGNRSVDFNEEGMVHIGLLPELLEDARRLGVSDEDLEPIFRSAEGYIRMWELAEQRAEALANP